MADYLLTVPLFQMVRRRSCDVWSPYIKTI